MDKPGFTPGLRATVFSALTGRSGDVSGQASGNVGDMLRAAYGESRRGAVNTRAAAAGLGVSQRTVQRWLAGEGRQRSQPSPGHLREITGQARRTATTQRGRRGALADTRSSSAARRGARLQIAGQQGPLADGRQYLRDRRITLNLPPEAVTAMLDAYETGGDRAFVSWLEQHASDEYVDGWSFGTITGIDIDSPHGGR